MGFACSGVNSCILSAEVKLPSVMSGGRCVHVPLLGLFSICFPFSRVLKQSLERLSGLPRLPDVRVMGIEACHFIESFLKLCSIP